MNLPETPSQCDRRKIFYAEAHGQTEPDFAVYYSYDEYTMRFFVLNVSDIPLSNGKRFQPMPDAPEDENRTIDPDVAQQIFEGTINYEGCTNMQIADHGVCVHFCGAEDALIFGRIMSALYDLASNNLLHWQEEAHTYESPDGPDS